LDIYSLRPFQWHKERNKARRFDSSNRLLNFRESRRTPSLHFWEWELHSPTLPKVGLWQSPLIHHLPQSHMKWQLEISLPTFVMTSQQWGHVLWVVMGSGCIANIYITFCKLWCIVIRKNFIHFLTWS
jgi:hypothetical protein